MKDPVTTIPEFAKILEESKATGLDLYPKFFRIYVNQAPFNPKQKERTNPHSGLSDAWTFHDAFQLQ
ncbi:hypothetical protein K7432_009609 [Basidiobolus ranarum]|uniref:Uncharacterized protein n=1 Tax=Basidiobolus ranarum TaxID=34480 RepID=A0ABR2WPY6_9FUNG